MTMLTSVLKQIGSGRIFAAFFLSLGVALTQSVGATEVVTTALDKKGNPMSDVIVYATPLLGTVPPVTIPTLAPFNRSITFFANAIN
ncbi:hypothetical protein ACO0KY_12880 [Undibacterium sp. Dicai25W]|uniref:hypothetical protein n=1 Tax=Undibacterium sp. Dicai25W TaxID=3413034 RepID=UPI003BF359D7